MRASAGKIDKVVDFENGRVDVEILQRKLRSRRREKERCVKVG